MALTATRFGVLRPSAPTLVRMEVRFYIDPETGEPHLHRHGVTETEAEEVLRRPAEDRPGARGARVAIGSTSAGRALRVVYVPDPDGEGIFVVTSFELTGKPLTAFRRRLRRRKR
jgi:hypothetical protein